MTQDTRTTFESMGRKFGALAAIALLGALSACASSADPGAMTLNATKANDKSFPAKFQHAMCVRTVSGGEATNPLWLSKVDDAGFRSALSGSLDSGGLTAPSDACHYSIDANLLGLSQPAMGFDMTVTSHVNYKVYDSAAQPALLATIDAPFTAKVSDSFLAVERLKMANEGSIRVSIEMFFDKLRDADQK
jgi:hypothetical protein